MTRRTAAQQGPIRLDHFLRAVGNVFNLSTPLGLAIGLLGGCRFRRGPNLTCYAEHYRLGFPVAGAFTVGNVILVPHRSADELEARHPGILAHEDTHSWQWSYCLGLPFLPLYLLAVGWSWLRTNDISSGNFFEQQAGLESGGYQELPRRPLREGFAALRALLKRTKTG